MSVELRKALKVAVANLQKGKIIKKSTYVPFDNGKSVKRRIKGFDAYFLANIK